MIDSRREASTCLNKSSYYIHLSKPMDIEKARQLIKAAQGDLASANARLDSALVFLAEDPPPETYTIKAGENLQSYLDKGGKYFLEPGAAFESNGFNFTKPVTLMGENNKLIGSSLPAVEIQPGVSQVTLSNIEGISKYNVVFLLGHNDSSQTTLESVPSNISFFNVGSKKHDGKRAFEINCKDSVFKSCYALEVNNPTGEESKAVNILNTPGNITFDSGQFGAASECILLGGDKKKIPGVYLRYVFLLNLQLIRPAAWFTDGVSRVIKNSCEIKDGSDILIDNMLIDWCWKDDQQGEAFMFTPSAGKISNVEVKNIRVRNCSSLLNFRGFDPYIQDSERSTNVTFTNIDAEVSSKVYGGRGYLALIDSPLDVSFRNVVCKNDGSSLVYATGKQMDSFIFENNKGNCGSYGLNMAGGANGSLMANAAKSWSVKNNTFVKANAAMKRNFPENTYVDIW